MSSLDPFCNAYLKSNMLQQLRNEEPKRKCTTTEGKIIIEGNGVDDDLSNIEQLSYEDGINESSSRMMNLNTMEWEI